MSRKTRKTREKVSSNMTIIVKWWNKFTKMYETDSYPYGRCSWELSVRNEVLRIFDKNFSDKVVAMYKEWDKVEVKKE